MQPRLQLIAPTQIRLLAAVSVDREEFKKDSVVSVEAHDARYLIDRKLAEKLQPGEKVESANRFDVVLAGKPDAKTADAPRQQAEENAAAAPKDAAVSGTDHVAKR